MGAQAVSAPDAAEVATVKNAACAPQIFRNWLTRSIGCCPPPRPSRLRRAARSPPKCVLAAPPLRAPGGRPGSCASWYRPPVRQRALLLFLPVMTASCAEAPGEPVGAVIVGITGDFRPGPDMARLRADMRIDGAEAGRREWSVSAEEGLSFPTELPFSDLPDGTRVDVSLSAFEGLSELEEPFLRRDAATSVAEGRTLLLRAHLEWECVPSFHLPGGALAPSCPSPETCVAAACEDPYVPPGALEDYFPSWAVDYADECRPEGAGEPEVEIGRGWESFEPLAPLGPVVLEKGSQGGFHVWLALRARNLHREGAVTTLEVHREDSGEELCLVEVPWDFTPSEGGSCDLVGIQCVVSYDIAGAAGLAGQAAVVSAKVVDLLGNVGFGQGRITLSTAP